jgi:hypothetical protein
MEAAAMSEETIARQDNGFSSDSRRDATYAVVRAFIKERSGKGQNPSSKVSVSREVVLMGIERLIKRHMDNVDLRIAVEAENGKVVLRGKVASLKERHEIGRAAWSAPGVVEVQNELEVM